MIVQADAFNQSRLSTLICVVLTSNVKSAAAPGNVLLHTGTTGLPKESVANVSQLITMNRTFLTEYVAQLPANEMRQVEQGMRLVLDL